MNNDTEIEHSIHESGLLPVEKSMMTFGELPIGTLTWFRGDVSVAAPILKDRVVAILVKNPWLLGGKIVKKKKEGRTVLSYADHIQMYCSADADDTNADADNTNTNTNKTQGNTSVIDEEILEKVFYYHDSITSNKNDNQDNNNKDNNSNNNPPPLSRQNTRIEDLYKAAQPWTLQDSLGPPLWRVVVCPCSDQPQTHFAVIVSLSHLVGDVHVFYKLHNMLFSDNKNNNNNIESLQVELIKKTLQQQEEALGKKEVAFMGSPPFAVRFVISKLVSDLWRPIRKKPGNREHWFVLNKQAIQETKKLDLLKQEKERKEQQQQQQQQQNQEEKDDTNNNPPLPPVSFVSTNDILTSWYFNSARCMLGCMRINLRNRLEGHTDVHARNYWSGILYQAPDYQTSVTIRQSLTNLRRTKTIHNNNSDKNKSDNDNDNNNSDSDKNNNKDGKKIEKNDYLPNPWDYITHGSIGIASNWTQTAQQHNKIIANNNNNNNNGIPFLNNKNNNNNNNNQFQEEAHIPLLNFAEQLPADFSVMRCFRAGPDGKIGVYIAGDSCIMEHLVGSPFEDPEQTLL